jgi:hypothetical protein
MEPPGNPGRFRKLGQDYVKRQDENVDRNASEEWPNLVVLSSCWDAWGNRRLTTKTSRSIRGEVGGATVGSLTVHVLDKDQRPIVGKRVYCSFPWFMGAQQRSDEDGIARFEHVPIGTTEVFVEGRQMLRVSVGVEHKDVTVTLGR